MAYTWTELLEAIKVRGAIPTSQSTYTEARLLAIANACLQTKIVPLVDKVREKYYSYDVDWTIVDGSSVLVPTRAVGGKLEDACFINGTERQKAALYWEEEIRDTSVAPGKNPGIYLKRNRVFVLPSDGGGWPTLRMAIIMRPNTIVAQTSAAQITAIDSGTKTITFASCPSTWTTSLTYDLIQQKPHFDWLAIDQAIGTLTATTMIFSSTLPTDLAVGDWVSLAGESTVVQCPVELQPLLAQEAANLCLKAQGDMAAYNLGKEEAKLLRDSVMSSITPRVELEGKILTNRTGLLRRRI